MIWDWLWRRLALDAHAAQIAALNGRIEYLERWVSGLDAALWRVDQQSSQAPADYKALADKIRSQVMASKKAFPTRQEDVR